MIQILITGGTIDKHYMEHNGALDFAETKIPSILEQGRFNAKVKYQTVMLKDSLDMNNDDRKKITDACKTIQATKILITHGTDTMVETASYIANNEPILVSEKAIVLVGAMVPKTLKNSDANFNMGFALGALSVLDAGVYIAMSGQIFPWNKVHKNRTEMVFETN